MLGSHEHGFFARTDPVAFGGSEAADPLSYRWYEPDRIVHGRRMEDQLRLTVCFWHSLAWPGSDVFGEGTFQRPWHEPGDPLDRAREKLDVGFELVRLLGVPFYAFHDRDVSPDGTDLKGTLSNLATIGDHLEQRQNETGTRLLWGTANLFSHRRYMAGAATNPDPAVFAFAAAQVKAALELTHRLGGANYVLWGGREGYETLLNTDLKRELDQFGRFLQLVVEHKHAIGFEGTILIEPKPCEPTKHQYDFDVASVYGFLQRFGLEDEVRVNIEANHATLAGHSFEHEVALATALGILGSLDMNRGDPQLGWDTDQFPNDVTEVARVLYHVLAAGGIAPGGLNFDAKLRRQSIDAVDLLHAHVGAIDTCARALLIAERMLTDDIFPGEIRARYAGWDGDLGASILDGSSSLDELAAIAAAAPDPEPRSGGQERLENIVSRYA